MILIFFLPAACCSADSKGLILWRVRGNLVLIFQEERRRRRMKMSWLRAWRNWSSPSLMMTRSMRESKDPRLSSMPVVEAWARLVHAGAPQLLFESWVCYFCACCQQMVLLLLMAGADVTLCDCSRRTVLHACPLELREKVPSWISRPNLPLQIELLQAAWLGDLHSVQTLLVWPHDRLLVPLTNTRGRVL